MIAVAMPTTTPAAPEPAGPSPYTIDELAAASHVPSRTIRFYQSRGALMPPEIRGRVAYYGPAHVERLELIAQLQDRGLRIDAIRDLLASIDRGELDLAEWLGVEQQVQAPWANDQPAHGDRGGALRAGRDAPPGPSRPICSEAAWSSGTATSTSCAARRCWPSR